MSRAVRCLIALLAFWRVSVVHAQVAGEPLVELSPWKGTAWVQPLAMPDGEHEVARGSDGSTWLFQRGGGAIHQLNEHAGVIAKVLEVPCRIARIFPIDAERTWVVCGETSYVHRLLLVVARQVELDRKWKEPATVTGISKRAEVVVLRHDDSFHACIASRKMTDCVHVELEGPAFHNVVPLGSTGAPDGHIRRAGVAAGSHLIWLDAVRKLDSATSTSLLSISKTAAGWHLDAGELDIGTGIITHAATTGDIIAGALQDRGRAALFVHSPSTPIRRIDLDEPIAQLEGVVDPPPGFWLQGQDGRVGWLSPGSSSVEWQRAPLRPDAEPKDVAFEYKGRWLQVFNEGVVNFLGTGRQPEALWEGSTVCDGDVAWTLAPCRGSTKHCCMASANGMSPCGMSALLEPAPSRYHEPLPSGAHPNHRTWRIMHQQGTNTPELVDLKDGWRTELPGGIADDRWVVPPAESSPALVLWHPEGAPRRLYLVGGAPSWTIEGTTLRGRVPPAHKVVVKEGNGNRIEVQVSDDGDVVVPLNSLTSTSGEVVVSGDLVSGVQPFTVTPVHSGGGASWWWWVLGLLAAIAPIGCIGWWLRKQRSPPEGTGSTPPVPLTTPASRPSVPPTNPPAKPVPAAPTPAVPGSFANGHALVIGIARYAAVRPLPDAVTHDAQAMRNHLVGRCGYREGQVELLVNEQATRRAIAAAFFRLRRRATRDATTLVYFSGHGARAESGDETSFLVPYDCQPDDLKGTALSAEIVTQALHALPADRVVMILDACHAGGSAHTKQLDADTLRPGLSKTAYDQLASGRGRVFLSSSRVDQQSYVKDGAKNSVFTMCLMEALSGADGGEGDTITAFDVFRYVSVEVPRREVRQNPVFKCSVEGDIALAPRPKDAPSEPPTSLRVPKMLSGKRRVLIRNGIGGRWQDLADYFEIPGPERDHWDKSNGAAEVLAWLERRGRLEPARLHAAFEWLRWDTLVEVLKAQEGTLSVDAPVRPAAL